jgi:universal stress protein A
MQIRTVLCPVDFSSLDPVEIDAAVEVCRTLGARLIVLHDLASAHPAFARAWDWDRTRQGHEPGQREAERRLRAMVERAGREVRAEGMITVGSVGTVVFAVAQQMGADLIVLGSHGPSTPDHASLTDRIVDASPCPVLTLAEHPGMPPFRLRTDAPGGAPPTVVVPTDLTRGSAPVVAYACALARLVPLRLDIVHVLDPGPASQDAQRRARAALDALVPPDLVDAVSARVRVGPATAVILEHVAAVGPVFTLVGEHARGLLRRSFTHDTTRDLVHRIECPVWVVPRTASA